MRVEMEHQADLMFSALFHLAAAELNRTLVHSVTGTDAMCLEALPSGPAFTWRALVLRPFSYGGRGGGVASGIHQPCDGVTCTTTMGHAPA